MNRPIPGGFFIAIEGIDGAGKSVQVRSVGAALAARGLDCVLTREPTDGPWGKLLRDSAEKGRLSPAEELNAFLEDRKAHVETLILPALSEGRIILTDRYYFSTVAYQGARGFSPEDLLRQNEAFAVEPHLLVIIDLDPEKSMNRIGHRDGKGNHFESVDLLKKSRQIFLDINKPYKVLIDGTQSADAVRDEILVAFSVFAVERIAMASSLSPAQKLAAIQAIHGVLEYAGKA